ncbi:Protein CBG05867 [Caenorhabditis briggsae]|uniref:Protein CBG05867 n=1 Tax=Caenorhabditis briggsae TaxID=6238 RepID=A8X1G3_CAEBR|nr:Protein CBG05867 [Caenorhabditis briggsae]CAP26473.2 Protein CBG05867 [Caenorhabditis briggsae]
MGDDLWKIPEVIKTLDIPVDSAVRLKVKIPIGDVLGLVWTGYWTVLNTAQGQFELKCEETSLCPWKLLAQVDTKFIGEGQTPELNFRNEIQFSQRMKSWKLSPIDQGRKYNKIELKLIRKSACGIRQENYINFDVHNKWLDARICSNDGSMKVYANSGVLALNSSVLRKHFEEKGILNDIIVPSSLFPALRKLLNFLHPPFSIEKETVGKVLELAQHWEMHQVLSKYESFLIKHRSYGQEATVKNIKLEEVLWNDARCVYTLLQENCFSTWTRAAIFEFILEIEDEDFEENEENDEEESENEDDGYSIDSDDGVGDLLNI